jgi:hypothetical protein
MSARASDRAWLPALLLLLGTAAFVWSGQLASVGDDCRNPDALRAGGGIPRTLHAADSTEANEAGAFQLTDGRVRQKSRKRAPLGFRVIRSDRAGAILFDLPPRFTPDGLHSGHRFVRKNAEIEGGALPITYRYDDSESGYRYFTAWFFAMSGRAITDPIEGAWRSLASSIGRGLPPITMVLVHGGGPIAEADTLEKRAESWLASVWAHYQRSCAP